MTYLMDLPIPGTPEAIQMPRRRALGGGGFRLEHVLNIPVRELTDPPNPTGPVVTLNDLKVADLTVNASLKRVVLATGQRPTAGLVVADTELVSVVSQMALPPMTYGDAIAYGVVNGRPLAVVGGFGPGKPGLLQVVDLTGLATGSAPVQIASLDLPARPSDILVDGTTVIVATYNGTSLGTAYVVSLANPEQPTVIGTISGVGTRLALTETRLLLSTMRSYTTLGAGPDGQPLESLGLKTAALETVLLIRRPEPTFTKVVPATPGTFGATAPDAAAAEEEETTADIPLRIQVIPPNAEPIQAMVSVLEDGLQSLSIPVSVALGFGQTIIASGYRRPLDSSTTARARATSSTGLPLTAAQSIPAGAVNLRADSNNDTIVGKKGTAQDLADRDAARGGKRFTFWTTRDPIAQNSLPGDLSDWQRSLTEFASVSVRLRTPVPAGVELALRMGGAQLEVARKITAADLGRTIPALPVLTGGEATSMTQCLAEDKLQFCYPPAAEYQARVVRQSVFGGWDAGLSPEERKKAPSYMNYGSGTVRLARDSLILNDNRFLIACWAGCQGVLELGTVDSGLGAQASSFKRLAYVEVEFKSVQELMGMVTLRQGLTGRQDDDSPDFKVRPAVEPVSGWAPAPDDIEQVNFLVHGFNVTHDEFAGVEKGWFATWAKRFYWAGLPVLKSQSAFTVGLSWPGDIPGSWLLPGQLKKLVLFPEDEFSALQCGVPFGKYVTEMRRRPGVRRVGIFAHSLGNMLVNNALKETVPVGAQGDAIINYVMNEAAVPIDAFLPKYNPLEQGPGSGVPVLIEHAERLGFGGRNGTPDSRYVNEETMVETFRSHWGCPVAPEFPPSSTSPGCSPTPNGDPDPLCNCDLPTRYFSGRLVAEAVLGAVGVPGHADSPFFRTRWGREGMKNQKLNGEWDGTWAAAWTRFFVANAPSDGSRPDVQVFNTYNTTDSVVMIDRPSLVWGLENPLNWNSLNSELLACTTLGLCSGEFRLFAWKAAQIVMKPARSVPSAGSAWAFLQGLRDNPTADDTLNEQKWWTLEIPGRPSPWRTHLDAAAAQRAIWDGSQPADGESIDKRTRQWAELTQWYPALAPAAGATAVPSLTQPLGADSLGFAASGRNVDLTAVGGSGGLVGDGNVSHSYLYIKPLPEVWRAYRVMGNLMRQGGAQP